MTNLAERQRAFLRAIHDDTVPLPQDWGNRQAAGMAVYRGNYRSALMGVLADVFERTALYVGEGPFRQASMHHVITHPPSGWTIDDAGAGFDATCAQLFSANREVAELAWLEWTMRDLATAPDSQPLTAAAFAQASAEFSDEDWAELRLAVQPRSAARGVTHDLDALWRALEEDRPDRPDLQLDAPQTCLVWREGDRPTFLLLEADHAAAFGAMASGASYAEMIGLLIGDMEEATPDTIKSEVIQNAAKRAGEMLGQWLSHGLVTGINP